MINKKEQRFFAELAISSPPQRVNFVKPRSLVRTSRALVPNVPIIIPKNNMDKSLIHVCFALYDGTKTYSRFTGTAILSLFENTKSKVMIHLLHDNTLTEDNREKLMQIVERYGQQLKFYNVEELCAYRLSQIEEFFPQAKKSHFSIAMFYRLFIPHLLLSQDIEKALYLDSDIIVNLDIKELWQIELGNKPLAATSRDSQIDKEISDTSKVIPLVREGVVNAQNYFHSGLMLMNLKTLHEKETDILAGMKFIGENPQFIYPDQDVLNYCFSTSYLKLLVKFNRVISFARSKNEWTIEKKIYHFAASRISLGMDLNDPYNRLFMDYFIKTPWFDIDTTATLSGSRLPSRKNYSVSVIIPIYNAAEFICECLDSLLIQTFQDFEVIVIDDCSTDSSCEIVESYMPKFNGRLRLEKLEKNSGGGGYIPRNIGIGLAHGEYIQFLDADDMLLGTALEILYKAAILHDAEVVYTGSYYRLNVPNNVYVYKDSMSKNKKMINIQTDLVVDDPKTNLNRLLLEPGEGNFRACWSKFVRRDFLIKNRIFFPHYLSNAGDAIWVINLYCHAKRFLRIAKPLYFYRFYNINSVVRKVRAPQEQYWYWFSTFVEFAKCLHELEKENKILAENPFYSLMTLKGHFAWCLNRTEAVRKELPNEELYKILYSEFVKTSDDSTNLLSFLFSSIVNEKNTRDNQATLIKSYAESINRFKSFITAKIFVFINKKMDTEAIQILSVSDSKAQLTKPEWWQRNGTCHMIDSYMGKIEIVAKAMTGGNVQIRLGGSYVLNPQDKSKRIPYWIDYTKFIVNDKVIFNTLTPVWHDKPYIYNMEVKAGKELKILFEWLPHRNEDFEQKLLSSPPKVKNPIPRNFMPFITARMEVKLLSKEGDFQILSVSDNNARITKPEYLQKGSTCYCIHTTTGKIKMVTKSSVAGQVRLLLRSMDIRDPKDNTKRIPYWLDYKNFVINGKKIFDMSAPICYDKFFGYNVDVKANEETEVEVEWLPHRSDATPSKKLLSQPLEEKILRNFMPFITARMEVKLLSKEGDFQILSVSDSNARITKPEYLQKGSTCYCIHTTTGKIKMITKSSVDGQVRLLLRSMDIRDPKDNTKHIPYWLDYKNLVINGKKIFDTSAPICYDKFFGYNVDVKANEETAVEVEWLPHRSDTP